MSASKVFEVVASCPRSLIMNMFGCAQCGTFFDSTSYEYKVPDEKLTNCSISSQNLQ